MPTIRSVHQEQIVYHPSEEHPEYRVVVSLDGSPFAVERYAGTDAAGARRWEPLAEMSPRSGGIYPGFPHTAHGQLPPPQPMLAPSSCPNPLIQRAPNKTL